MPFCFVFVSLEFSDESESEIDPVDSFRRSIHWDIWGKLKPK